MSFRHGLSVFWAALRIGIKGMLAEPLVLLGSFVIYAALVVAYGNVFRGIPADDLARYHLSLSEMIWYFGATEFVLFCSSLSQFKDVQYDIQNDRIHLSLLRPCPHWIVRLGEWSGQSIARFLVLVVPSFALVSVMAGGSHAGAVRFFGLLMGLPLGVFILLCSNFVIGVSCLWLKQADPFFWVWQKLLFVLGALLWPLAIYPPLLRSSAWLTPFPSVLAVPAQWLLDSDVLLLAAGFGHQLFWALIMIGVTAAVNRAMLRSMQNSGD